MLVNLVVSESKKHISPLTVFWLTIETSRLDYGSQLFLKRQSRYSLLEREQDVPPLQLATSWGSRQNAESG